MPLMSAELYDALVEAGASEEKARKAAESVAQIAEMRTDVAVIKTMVEQLQHRLTLVVTLVIVVLGGVLSTLWVLAR